MLKNIRRGLSVIILITIVYFNNFAYGAGIPSLTEFSKISNQAGGNPGGTYHKDKKLFYLKFPAEKKFNNLSKEQSVTRGEAIAKNEALAAKLYQLAGIKTPQFFFIYDHNNNLGIGSEIETTFKSIQESLRSKQSNLDYWPNLPGTQEGLIIDAWLANWDVAGSSLSNIGEYTNPLTGNQEAFRVDVGGALLFSGIGIPKSQVFGNSADEWDLLRGTSGTNTHPMSGLERANLLSAQLLFGQVTEEQILKSITTLNKIDPAILQDLINHYAPGTDTEKRELYNTLLVRKQDLTRRLSEELEHFQKTVVDSKNQKLKITRFKQLVKYTEDDSKHQPTREVYTEIINSYLASLKQVKNYNDLPAIFKPDENSKNALATLSLTGTISNMINDRMMRNFYMDGISGIAGGGEFNKQGVWIKGIISKARQKTYNLTAGYKLSQSGATIGYDFGEQIICGGALSYINANITGDDSSRNKNHITNLIATLYALAGLENNIFLSAQGQYGIVRSNKSKEIGDFAGSIAKGKTNGNIMGARIDSGYDYISGHNRNWHIIPSAGIGYDKVTFKAYKETDQDGFSNSIGKAVSYRASGLFGLRSNYNFLIHNYKVVPEIHANINYILHGRNSATKISFGNGIDGLTLKADKPQKAIYSIGSLITLSSLANLHTTLGYDFTLSGKFKAHTCYATLRVDF